MIKIEDYDYESPTELIAQEAISPRDGCRLLVVNKKNNEIEEKVFKDIAGELGKNDVLVLNESRVFPARLMGKKESGGKVELLLLKKINEKDWEAISRPGLKVGKKLVFSNLKAEVIRNRNETLEIRFEFEGDLWKILEKIGKTPIPPYIHNNKEAEIRRDYQTVYAANYGSAAAPTAGLHFTDELLNKLLKNGVQVEKVNLNVGLGTFKPITEKKFNNG